MFQIVKQAHAQIEVLLPPIKPPISSAFTISGIVGLAFKVMLIVAAIYALLQIVLAGYDMISSGGDKGSLEKARGKIIWSIIGIVVIVSAWGLIMLVEGLLGVCLGFSCPIDLDPTPQQQLFIPTG